MTVTAKAMKGLVSSTAVLLFPIVDQVRMQSVTCIKVQVQVSLEHLA